MYKSVGRGIYMERLLLTSLLQWKKRSRRKPLVIHGARQVGKTWIMREFGKRYFADTVYISFDNNERMRNVFELDYAVRPADRKWEKN